MIKVNIKKMHNMHIAVQDLIEIGDVVLKQNNVVYCRSRTVGSNLEVFGELHHSIRTPSSIIMVKINNISLDGIDREYEKSFKNICARSYGELHAFISVNNGERLLKFRSKDGEMFEEEIRIEDDTE